MTKFAQKLTASLMRRVYIRTPKNDNILGRFVDVEGEGPRRRCPVRRHGERIGTRIHVGGSIGWGLAIAVFVGSSVHSSVAWASAGLTADLTSTPIVTDVGAGVRDPIPDPGLAPDEVVGIVLHALQHNDDPEADHGIAITFAFTSPENHDVIGPIDRFRALVKSPAYRLMIGHAKSQRGPMVVNADHAHERVAITGSHGERAVYVFMLSRQEGGAHKGCWMADGMLREADPASGGRDRSMLTPVAYRRD